MDELRKKVRVFALYTRLFILILQFVCNWVIPDHQAGVFQWTVDPKWEPTVLDRYWYNKTFHLFSESSISVSGHNF